MRACPPNLRRRIATALLSLVTLAGAGTLSAQADNPHEADLALTKTAAPAPPVQVPVNGFVTYTIQVRNYGSNDTDQQDLPGTKVEIDDTAPEGILFLSTEITRRSTNGDRCKTTEKAVHCDIHGNIRPGGVDYVEVQITGVVTELPADGKPTCNVAKVKGNHPDRNPSNDSNSPTSACINVGGTPSHSADLSITKQADKTSVSAGDTVTYTLTVKNAGPDTAEDVVVEDALPEELLFLSFADGPPSSCSHDAGVVRCEIASMPDEGPGSEFVVRFTVQVKTAAPGTEICNSASVSSDDKSLSDPKPLNNLTKACLPVPPEADLSIVKKANRQNALIGEDLIYTAEVKNNGPNAATNVTVKDDLPSEATFVWAQASQGSCTQSDPVQCSLGTIAKNGTATVTIKVRPNAKGMIENTAKVKADQKDPDLSNNSSTIRTPYVKFVNSGAFGEMIDVKTILGLKVKSGPLASVTLPPGGGGPFTASAATVNVTGGYLLKDLVKLEALTGRTQGGRTADDDIYVASSADIVKASLVNGLITVEGIHSECRAAVNGPGDSSSHVLNLTIGGTVVKVQAGVTAEIPVPLVGTLYLNEQITTGSGLNQQRTVNALHLKLNGLLAKGDIILAHSDCGIDP